MMWFVWIPLLVLVAVLIYILLKDDKSGIKDASPLEILRKRFARGEISKEECHQRKQQLQK